MNKYILKEWILSNSSTSLRHGEGLAYMVELEPSIIFMDDYFSTHTICKYDYLHYNRDSEIQFEINDLLILNRDWGDAFYYIIDEINEKGQIKATIYNDMVKL